MTGFDNLARHYGVRYKRGQRVTVDGEPGRVTSADTHLRVRFDGIRHSLPCHPTWRVQVIDTTKEAAHGTTQEAG